MVVERSVLKQLRVERKDEGSAVAAVIMLGSLATAFLRSICHSTPDNSSGCGEVLELRIDFTNHEEALMLYELDE